MNHLKSFRNFKKVCGNIFNNLNRADCKILMKDIPNDYRLNVKNYSSTSVLLEEKSELIDDVTLGKLSKKIPDVEKKIQLILLEIESLRINGFDLTGLISEKNWKRILKKSSYSERKKIYLELEKQSLKDAQYLEKKNESNLKNTTLSNHLEYRIGKNCNLLRIYPNQISNLLNCRLLSAQLFSNDIVIDMGYENYMNDHQLKDCAHQLGCAINSNKNHENPFNIHLCNYSKNSKLNDYIKSILGDEIFNSPINVHEGSYMDIFEKDRLVYLSPDATSNLREYESNSIYIIGGFSDFGRMVPVSISKAKKDQIRTVKFPVDLYLNWKHGVKSFAFNVALNVMNDFQYYRNWKIVFENVPKKVWWDTRKEFEVYK